MGGLSRVATFLPRVESSWGGASNCSELLGIARL